MSWSMERNTSGFAVALWLWDSKWQPRVAGGWISCSEIFSQCDTCGSVRNYSLYSYTKGFCQVRFSFYYDIWLCNNFVKIQVTWPDLLNQHTSMLVCFWERSVWPEFGAGPEFVAGLGVQTRPWWLRFEHFQMVTKIWIDGWLWNDIDMYIASRSMEEVPYCFFLGHLS